MYFCTPKINPGLGVESERIRVDLVAQLVEHYTFNVGVLGSSPSGITTLISNLIKIAQKALQILSCRVFYFLEISKNTKKYQIKRA